MPVLAFKAIKPRKLRDKDLRLELLNAVRKVGRAIEKDYKRTTKTWKDKPKFEQVISLSQPGPTVLVGTDSLIYKFVDEGTKAHEIWAGAYTGKSDKKTLAFQTGHKSKTLPGVLDARSGGKSGPWVHPPMVHHPGTEARDFTKMLEKQWKPRFKRGMEEAMVRAAKKSDHGA